MRKIREQDLDARNQRPSRFWQGVSTLGLGLLTYSRYADVDEVVWKPFANLNGIRRMRTPCPSSTDSETQDSPVHVPRGDSVDGRCCLTRRSCLHVKVSLRVPYVVPRCPSERPMRRGFPIDWTPKSMRRSRCSRTWKRARS